MNHNKFLSKIIFLTSCILFLGMNMVNAQTIKSNKMSKKVLFVVTSHDKLGNTGESTEVLTLSLYNREKLCADMHKIEHFFRKKSNNGYIALQRRILSLLNSNAKERYEKFISQYPTLLQRLPKTLIASYLGVSRETLSRLSV